MLRVLVHNWWLLLFRGILALAFAIFVLFAQTVGPAWLLRAIALASVVEFFGLFAFCAGLLTIVAAIRSFGKESEWWWLLVDGLGACIAGGVALTAPDLTFLNLVRLIGLWALFLGSAELIMARKLRRHVPDEWFLALAAIGSLAFGLYLWFGWHLQLHQLLASLGAYTLFSACTMLALGMRLRKLRSLAHLAAQHIASPARHS
ncbi:MAG TPA: DUF308 domain-containing protein [Candidatus Angelobacter sp.]|jgi:uncharacterized membrane protein HdeD (DUF308 family)|nr:DUF308 domain-containing protein [Candidatus Angelobacter sp.]